MPVSDVFQIVVIKQKRCTANLIYETLIHVKRICILRGEIRNLAKHDRFYYRRLGCDSEETHLAWWSDL